MKSLLLAITCLTLLLCKPGTSYAGKGAGGELVYEWISDSTYRILFKFYRDCSDTTYPSSMPLCIYNPCSSVTQSLTMTKFGVADTSFPNICGVKSSCDSVGSTLNGFKSQWYSALTVLNGRCNSWRFSVTYSSRVASNNISNSSTIPLYVEARFNNMAAQGNSSPYFSTKPSTSFCLNMASSYNYNATDPNGDSVVSEVIMPLTRASSTGCDSPINTTFTTGLPVAYSIPSNPFQTQGTFTINAGTGAMGFTPKQGGTSILTVRVKEYRNGVLIGSIMRDITINVPGSTVGVEEVSRNTALNVYPNPNSGSFTIGGLEDKKYTLEVTNALGQLVYRYSGAPVNGELSIATKLGNGVYQLRMTDEANNVKTQRFVVAQ
ncbi:MAG: T9SS type A sorting domain-containing protein [Sphingobacteriales bacterium]|nr:MAG: T9SS type A sorting domain-containing protein [Sphingobacteriales bacterium]